jgi:hypothetical protein
MPYGGAGLGGATGAALAAMPYAGAGLGGSTGAALMAIPYAGAAVTLVLVEGGEAPEVAVDEGPHPATASPRSTAAARGTASSRRRSDAPQ